MVAAGYMGKKSGRGFYDYSSQEDKPIAVPGQVEGEAKDTETPAPYGESETKA